MVGFRKTLAVRPRGLPTHDRPDWRLSFILPDGAALPPDAATGLIAVAIGRNGWVEIAGKRRDFVITQCVRLLRDVMPQWRGVILARLIRSDEPGPTLGPIRRGERNAVEIPISGRQHPMVTEGSVMWQLELSI